MQYNSRIELKLLRAHTPIAHVRAAICTFCHTVESGYQAHLFIRRTFAIRRMPSSCQNLHKLLLTGAVTLRVTLRVAVLAKRATRPISCI